MFSRHSFRKAILRLCVLFIVMPSLGSCGAFDYVKSVAEEAVSVARSWTEETGNTIVNFFTGPVSDWWNGLVDGATKIYDDVSGAVVDGFNTFTTSVADCYESVKNGVVTFYNGAIEKLKIKEAYRSTEDYALYEDDNQVKVYALLEQQLCTEYSVFPAYVYHPSTHEVIDGIGFSSTEHRYVDEDGVGYFGAGFLSGIGEIELDQTDIEQGIEIVRPDNETEYKYIYCYDVEPFQSHFIANNRYVQFGVGDNRNIVFEEEETTVYGLESDYGGLFNFDTGKWVFGDSNNYVRTNGNILEPEMLDTTKLIASLGDKDNSVSCSFSITNLINGASNIISELKTHISAIKRTILGENVSAVLDALSRVKASDIFSVDGSKFTFQNIPEKIGPFDANALAIGLAIGGMILSIALTIVLRIASGFFPPLKLLEGIPAAMRGCCVDALLQMCLEEKDINQVNWLRLIINSVCSAIGAYTGGKVVPTVAGAIGESVAAFVGEGETLGKAGTVFLNVLISSILVSGAFSLLSKGSSASTNAIGVTDAGSTMREANEDLASEMLESVLDSWSDMSDGSDGAIPESEKAARAYNRKVARQMIGDNNPNFYKIDENGDEVLKMGNQIEEMLLEGSDIFVKPRPTCDEVTLAKLKAEGFSSDDTVARFNGRFTIFEKTYGNVDVGEGLIGYYGRRKTFEKADVLLMNQWINDSDSAPNKVLDYLSMKNKTVDDLDKQTMQEIRRELRLTWHEVSDRALQLVSRDIHEMMSQTGGASYSKILVAHGNTQALLKPLVA